MARSRYRRYSDTARAAALLALDANGGNVLRTSRETGIPRVTLLEWDRGHVADEVSDFRHTQRERLADRLEGLAHQILDAIPGKVEDASLRDLVAALAVCIDRMRLLRELPTQIDRQESLSDEERLNALAALLDTARARANGKGPPGVH